MRHPKGAAHPARPRSAPVSSQAPEPKDAASPPTAPKVWTGRRGHRRWTLVNNDALRALKELAARTVDCVITSPPYFWQRDYEHGGQTGHESTIEEYVETIRKVFSEVKRVLRPTGVLFLVLGDTYYSARGQPRGPDPKQRWRAFARAKVRAVDTSGLGLPRKSLIGIPWRVALALQQDGWRIRSAVVWRKAGAMTEPNVRDRPRGTTEQIFILSKADNYYFDRAALGQDEDVWEFAVRPAQRAYPHSAAFPEALVERCIDCGCPPGGTVLDPYAGSGTTLRVALQRRRSAIGIELNSTYCAMAQRRVILSKDDQTSSERPSRKKTKN